MKNTLFLFLFIAAFPAFSQNLEIIPEKEAPAPKIKVDAIAKSDNHITRNSNKTAEYYLRVTKIDLATQMPGPEIHSFKNHPMVVNPLEEEKVVKEVPKVLVKPLPLHPLKDEIVKKEEE
jgi:hypothetical protein